ncbi:MAG: hypothetical protein GWP06_17875 [Actinobacteria bacterium]|nr:hypothetical protein [Actinomycetota bacterium]
MLRNIDDKSKFAIYEFIADLGNLTGPELSEETQHRFMERIYEFTQSIGLTEDFSDITIFLATQQSN